MNGKLHIALAVAALAATSTASADNIFPPEFHGLWVANDERECPALTQDEDAYGMGEGALLLRGNKFYSHESLCRMNGRVAKSCCDGENERTIAADYSCGRYRGRVLFHLRPFAGGVMLVESYENAASGPVVKIYRKKCRLVVQP